MILVATPDDSAAEQRHRKDHDDDNVVKAMVLVTINATIITVPSPLGAAAAASWRIQYPLCAQWSFLWPPLAAAATKTVVVVDISSRSPPS